MYIITFTATLIERRSRDAIIKIRTIKMKEDVGMLNLKSMRTRSGWY